MPVIAFAVLNSNVATAVDGYGFYTDGSMSVAYLISAASSLVAIVIVLTLHRRRKQITEQVAAQTAAEFPHREPSWPPDQRPHGTGADSLGAVPRIRKPGSGSQSHRTTHAVAWTGQ